MLLTRIPDHSFRTPSSGIRLSAGKFIGLGLLVIFTFLVIALTVLRSNSDVEAQGLYYFVAYIDLLFGWWALTTDPALDFLQPQYIFILAFSLYAWSTAAGEVLNGGTYASIMPIYYRAVIVGMLGFIVGYWAATKSNTLRNLRGLSLEVSTVRFLNLCWLGAISLGLLITTGVFGHTVSLSVIDILNPYQITAYTAWSSSTRINQGSTAGLGDFLSGTSTELLIVSLVVASFSKRRPSKLGIIVVLVLLIPTVMAGQKGVVIFALLLIAMSIHYLIKPINLKFIATLALPFYVFITVQTAVRNTTDLGVMWDSGVKLVRQNPDVLLPVRSGEFNGPPVSLMNVIRGTEAGWLSYTYGQTSALGLTSMVPRFVWPGRPVSMEEQYMKDFFPNEAARGQGRAFFIATEGYWGFGYAGVFAEMFLYGCLLSFLYRVFMASRKNVVTVVLYAILYFPLVMTSVRGDMLGSIKAALMILLPFLGILYFSSRIVRSPKARDRVSRREIPQKDFSPA